MNLRQADTNYIPLTPTSASGVKALFEGFCAIVETIELGAPASAAIAVTPSVMDLLRHFCGDDPRYGRVAANLYVVSRKDIKDHCIWEGQPPRTRKIGFEELMGVKVLGVPLPVFFGATVACLLGLIVYILGH